MSGVEAIIGTVLGGGPLLKSAKDKAASAVDFPREYRYLIQDVDHQRMILSLHLRDVLSPLAKVEASECPDVDDLLKHLNGDHWKHRDVEAAMRENLGEYYRDYMMLFNDTRELLDKLSSMLKYDDVQLRARLNEHIISEGSKLPLQSEPQTSALEIKVGSRLRWEKQRLKHSLQKSAQEKVRDRICESIQKLKNFPLLHEQITSINRGDVPVAKVKYLLQYWKHASRIYCLLLKAWNCDCKESHHAYVWLQPPLSRTVFHFQTLAAFASREQRIQRGASWDPQHLDIRSLTESSELRSQPRIGDPASASPMAQTSPPITPQSSSKKSRLFKSSKSRSTGDAGMSPHKGVPSFKPAHTTDLKVVDSLCTDLERDNCCSGRLVTQNDDQRHQYSVHSQATTNTEAGEITLAEVLAAKKPSQWPLVQRLYVALAIASSHLMLTSTPWMPEGVQATDIAFSCKSFTLQEIHLERPYVSTTFSDNSKQKKSCMADTAFACLGIILLELYFCCSLEAHELWELDRFAGQQNVVMYRLMVATHWAREAAGQAGPRYSDMVIWCLCSSPPTLEGTRWRRDLLDKVVKPLEDFYNTTKVLHGVTGDDKMDTS